MRASITIRVSRFCLRCKRQGVSPITCYGMKSEATTFHFVHLNCLYIYNHIIATVLFLISEYHDKVHLKDFG